MEKEHTGGISRRSALSGWGRLLLERLHGE